MKQEMRKWVFKSHTALILLPFFTLYLFDWWHDAETHRGGLSSFCLRVNGNLVWCEGRGESARQPGSSGAPGGGGRGGLVENKAEGRQKQP